MGPDPDKIGLLARITWFLIVFCTGMVVVLVAWLIVVVWIEDHRLRHWSAFEGWPGYYILVVTGVLFLIGELRYARPIQRWLTPYKVLSGLLSILLMISALVLVGITGFVSSLPVHIMSDVTYLSWSARLDSFLDEQCIEKALRSAIGVRYVYVERFPDNPYPMYNFSSTEAIDGWGLHGYIRHERRDEFGGTDLNKVGGSLPIIFNVSKQGDIPSDAWGRETYYFFARVAKHVTAVCGAHFYRRVGLQPRCEPKTARLCRELLGDKAPY